ncbi:hypothetical protein F2Q69_00008637 [Brassica cretica]|uniref:Uncharacterized protein n=1 Tax=Brassica cretica TaxID=69181 RepID=A0A8S9P7B1_BRACR|nr:hypothetical protein F2Q69_00008637 [Brassica cretica]
MTERCVELLRELGKTSLPQMFCIVDMDGKRLEGGQMKSQTTDSRILQKELKITIEGGEATSTESNLVD